MTFEPSISEFLTKNGLCHECEPLKHAINASILFLFMKLFSLQAACWGSLFHFSVMIFSDYPQTRFFLEEYNRSLFECITLWVTSEYCYHKSYLMSFWSNLRKRRTLLLAMIIRRRLIAFHPSVVFLMKWQSRNSNIWNDSSIAK